MAFTIAMYSILLFFSIICQSMARNVLRLGVASQDVPLPPSQDPFYTPDKDWEVLEPGTILKRRSVTVGSIITLPIPLQSAHQLLYRTTDAQNQPSYAVTTVLMPINAQLDRLLSYQVAYNSPNPDCSPSYTIQFGAPTAVDDPVLELSILAEPFLLAGIPVSIPDYEALKVPMPWEPNITGIESNATTTLFGYSGGAIASEWAGELHSSYAPDVKIAGAAIGGLPVNATQAFSTLDGTSNSGLLVGGLNGLANAFPSIAQYIKEHLKPEFKSDYDLPMKKCAASVFNSSDGYVSQLADKNISAFFDNGWSVVSEFAEILDSVYVMGQHGVPEFPMFVFQGTADTTVGSLGNATDLVQQYCRDGAVIHYAQVAEAEHIPALFRGFPRALSFLMDIYNGIIPDKCTDTEVLLI
ncbi:lipase [Aspergillus bombycis]|uniref:Lipase n=1 Tax=Aspergillus bombycis TaxID=109264 RepID=A0A1F8A8A8_9EURO|nr:lipase [Aspergillus bombycis]OGM47913.1 lipase [Aspergillus bombycis]